MQQEVKMKSTEFKPLAEYVLVHADKITTEETTSSGIILKSEKSVIDRPVSGTVIAVGNKVEQVHKNDYVVFPKTDGIDVKFTDSNSQDTVEYILLRENSIIGKRQ